MSESHQEVSSTSSSPDIPTIADEVTFSDAVESNELHTEVEGGEEKEEEEEENEVVEVEVGVEEGEEESKVALETVVVAELECTESAAVLTEVTENCVEVELDAKLPSCSKVIPKSKHRVYIKNIPYYSTEDELEAFFIDYNVIHVLIPSYSFHGYAIKKWRPLGVGYAEFATKEDVSKVIEELDGALFNDRKIMIRAYRVASNEKSEPIPAPITKSKPKSKSKSRTKPRSPKPKTPSVPNSPKVVPSSPKVPEFDCTLIPVAANLKPTKEANNTSDVIVTKDRFKLSEDTIYINKVSNLVTIEDVKDFFEGYNVGSVYLFEKKDIAGSNQIKRTFSMSGRQRSVLVTLKSKKKEVVDPELLVSEPVDETVEPESIKLLDVIKEFRSKKLDGRTVILRAAYLTKVDEVLRAANSTNYSFYD